MTRMILGERVSLKSMGRNYELFENDELWVIEHAVRPVKLSKKTTDLGQVIDLIMDLNDEFNEKRLTKK